MQNQGLYAESICSDDGPQGCSGSHGALGAPEPSAEPCLPSSGQALIPLVNGEADQDLDDVSDSE